MESADMLATSNRGADFSEESRRNKLIPKKKEDQAEIPAPFDSSLLVCMSS